MSNTSARRRRLSTRLMPFLLLVAMHMAVRAEEMLPDVRLLIDVSGSMRESDPNNLREPALELMVRLLPEGSRAGVWTFGQWVNMPVAHREVDDLWREEASRAVAQINNHGLLTNSPEALEKASYDANRLDYQFKTSIILLTDGRVEVSRDEVENSDAARKVLEKLAIEFRDTGVEVHTIALSENADHEFLRQLAQATGGLAEVAESPDELSSVFLQALDIAAPTEQVPLLGGEFLIDDSVEEFTALVFPESPDSSVVLIDPQGQQFTAEQRTESVSWFAHEHFQLITVANPHPGEWRIAAPGSEARINIISHLTVVVDAPPTSLEVGHSPELGISLMDSTRIIRDPDLLSLVNTSVRVQRGADESWEMLAPASQGPDRGEYRLRLPMLAESGRYEITVTVDGGSFQREHVLVVDVFEPPPPQQVLPPAVTAPSGPRAWLIPAAVPALLLLALGLWWLRQRLESYAGRRWKVEDDFDDAEPYLTYEDLESDEEDYDVEYDNYDDEYEEDGEFPGDAYAYEDDDEDEDDYDYEQGDEADDGKVDDDDLLKGITSADPGRRD
jgi:hypothetical protein